MTNGSDTWLGFVGTSGGLGSNVIATVSMKVSQDGASATAWTRGTALGVSSDSSWGFAGTTLT